ncbi:hypothetical protein MB27_05630 [Actinoplanes utahensis]|uniref:Uncharacterized protein n=1 Tax=Actinoplanes utahensis TaxID=1869 RepID=A0A0A6XE21_ACTUT|nr:hypothetical protein MB27_05630 [Actinoplanes utahensis]
MEEFPPRQTGAGGVTVHRRQRSLTVPFGMGCEVLDTAVLGQVRVHHDSGVTVVERYSEDGPSLLVHQRLDCGVDICAGLSEPLR